MSYILEHTVLGFCWWDLPALILLIAVIVVFAWKHHDVKNEGVTGSLNSGQA